MSSLPSSSPHSRQHTGPDLAIDISAATKSFGGRVSSAPPVQAVRGIDLQIRAGEVVALLGPNGAGKSTTLDMVLGLTEPTSGTVHVLGRRPRAAVHDGAVSAVLQSGGLLRDLTVRETVQMIASTYAAHAPIDDVIARADLTSIAGRKVSKCSGGEQQRLRFALALLPDPQVLILDEPTAGMDVSARHTFWEAMHAEAAAGRTIVFATHYLEEADTFAERIVMMSQGRIVADGPTEQIRARATGMIVTASVRDDRVDAVRAALLAMPQVHDVSFDELGRRALRAGERHRITVSSSDSDEVAKALLVDLDGVDLEIRSGSLDTAFLALTGPEAHEPTTPELTQEAMA